MYIIHGAHSHNDIGIENTTTIDIKCIIVIERETEGKRKYDIQ